MSDAGGPRSSEMVAVKVPKEQRGGPRSSEMVGIEVIIARTCAASKNNKIASIISHSSEAA